MISEEFKKNVASCDLDTVRSALIDYLIIDRTFKSFDNALEYAKRSLNIIESFNNEPPFSEEPWDSHYLNQQKVALMMNFSNERIEHIKNVISKVLPVRTSEKDSVVHSTGSPTQTHTGSRTGRSIVTEMPAPSHTNSRTGRYVVSETPIQPKNPESTRPSANRKNSTTHKSQHNSTNSSERTGSRVVSETPVSSKGTEEKAKSDTDNIGTALIVGGAAVAVVGLVTIEPIVIGTGVVIAGAGVSVKAKNRR